MNEFKKLYYAKIRYPDRIEIKKTDVEHPIIILMAIYPSQSIEDYIRKNEMIPEDAKIVITGDVIISKEHPVSLNYRVAPFSDVEHIIIDSIEDFHNCTEKYFELFLESNQCIYPDSSVLTEYYIHMDGQLEKFYKDYALYEYTFTKGKKVQPVYLLTDVEEKVQQMVVFDYMKKGYELDVIRKADSLIGHTFATSYLNEKNKRITTEYITTDDNLYHVLNNLYPLKYKSKLFYQSEGKRYPMFVYGVDDGIMIERIEKGEM